MKNTATTNATQSATIDCELTDTFNNEANYSWVRRKTLTVPADISARALVRRGKAALGLSGVSCRVSHFGDTIELRPYGSCTIAFLSTRY